MPIPMKEESAVNRSSITLVVVAAICLAAFAYSNGWFAKFRPEPAVESNKVSAIEASDHVPVINGDTQMTAQTTEPTVKAAE